MTDWDGKSRGTVAGLKVFIFFIKHLGLRATYALLYLPVPYFLLFSRKTSRNNYIFFRKRLGLSKWKAFVNVCKTYYKFGQAMVDRMAVATGNAKQFSFEFDGIHHIENLIEQNQGGILMTAHIGNINVSRSFFDKLGEKPSVNMMVTDNERENIKDYLDSVSEQSELKYITVKDDFSHIFQLNKVLQNKELVVFAADRSGEGKGQLKENFLGKPTTFFPGPFKLASKKKLPILFVYIMREKDFHFHFYARPYSGENYEVENILKAYLNNLETMVKKYPNQWFNFYDYWEDFREEQ